MSAGTRLSALTWLLSLALGGILVLAALPKIQDPALFALQLKYYKLFPLWSLHLVALLVPWWELTTGIALLVPPLRKGAALLSLLLVTGFLVSVSQALFRGLDIACGCFGEGSGKLGWITLLLDVFLLGLTLVLLLIPARPGGQVEANPARA